MAAPDSARSAGETATLRLVSVCNGTETSSRVASVESRRGEAVQMRTVQLPRRQPINDQQSQKEALS